MAKIIHAADLHIENGEEKPYCYGVLDEIIALALAEKPAALVLAGDVFDSFADFEALRSEVCAKFQPLADAGCPIVYIPGNHEGRGAAADLTAYSLAPLTFAAARPFSLTETNGVEFLCVPHAENYEGYRDWQVPPKKAGTPRVVVAHALNPAIYAGPDEETEARAGVMDDDLFARFGADYAALGHVHAGRQQTLGGAVACYPGSARVWRAHPREAGPRRVCVVTLGAGVSVATVELKAAGLYKEYTLPLDLAGAVAPAAADRIAAAVTGLDLVKIILTGVVEDEKAAAASGKALRAKLKDKARLVELRAETIVAGDISSNSLTRAFLAEMDKLEPEDAQGPDYRRWLLARQYGLQELAAHLVEGR
jgi:DNA repair exonuclease SbcCD nuclease subunit